MRRTWVPFARPTEIEPLLPGHQPQAQTKNVHPDDQPAFRRLGKFLRLHPVATAIADRLVHNKERHQCCHGQITGPVAAQPWHWRPSHDGRCYFANNRRRQRAFQAFWRHDLGQGKEMAIEIHPATRRDGKPFSEYAGASLFMPISAERIFRRRTHDSRRDP